MNCSNQPSHTKRIFTARLRHFPEAQQRCAVEGRVHSTAGRGAGLLSAKGPVTLFILLVALSPSDAEVISLCLGIAFRLYIYLPL